MLFPPPQQVGQAPRVVVTGAGIITGLGQGWKANAEGFRAGRVALRPVTLFDVSRQRVKVAGEADLPAQLPATRLSDRELPRLDRAAKLLLLAAHEAWQQSGWEPAESLPIVLGTTSGGMSLGEAFYRQAIQLPHSRRHQAARALHYQAQRQALNLAVDRKRFTGTVLGGLSEPWNLPWPSYSEAYESAKQSVTPFDLDKAKSLLSSAGASGAEVELVYRSTDGELAQFVQIYKADLATIGVNLNVKPLESAVYSSVTNQRQYQMSAASSAAAQYHPSTVFYFGGNRYFGGVDQATVDNVSSEPDESKRRALYSAMNDFILDQSLDMVIGQTQRALVFAKAVHGLDRRVNQVTYYTETWLQS